MSDFKSCVRRYFPAKYYASHGEFTGAMWDDPEGDYVLYSDYAALKSELFDWQEKAIEHANNSAAATSELIGLRAELATNIANARE